MKFKALRIFAFQLLLVSFSLEAHSNRCLELLQGLLSTTELRAQNIEFRSIAKGHPEILAKFLELKPDPIDYTVYLAHFLREHDRAPTLREAIEYSYEVRRDMHDGYHQLIEELADSDSVQLQHLRRELSDTLEGLPQFNDLNRLEIDLEQRISRGETPAVTSINAVMEIETRDGKVWFEENAYYFLRDRTGLGNYMGHYGEILTLIHTPDRVISRGLKFDIPLSDAVGPYQKEIAQRVMRLEEELRVMNRDELKAVVEAHVQGNTGLLRFVKNFIDENPTDIGLDEIVNKILHAVMSKEIDMVSLGPDEKLIWSEIKAYGRPISVETLTRGSGKKLMDQLIEHRSVATLLGYGDEVQMRFYSPLTSVEGEAQALLESIGYQVNP